MIVVVVVFTLLADIHAPFAMMTSYQMLCRKILLIGLVFGAILQCAYTDEDNPRWSRQISNNGYLNDWIPVQPRQANGRVLNFGPPFAAPPQQNGLDTSVFANNQQAVGGQQTTTNLGEPFQRIFLQQMHPPNLPILPQHNQQQLHVSNVPSTPFRLHHDMHLNGAPQQNFIFQHAPQHDVQNQQHFRFPPFTQTKPDFLRNVEPTPQTQQLVQGEPSQLKSNGIENQQPALEMHQLPPQPQEEVQLLYVPLDTLYHQHQHQHDKVQNTRYNVLPPAINPLQVNNLYTHTQKFPSSTPAPTSPPFKIATSTAKLRTTTQRPVHRFSFNSAPAAPVEVPKPKSHQPPLAMFMRNSLSMMNTPTVNDVLSNLIFSHSIDVVDSLGGQTPEIFIGPHGLNTPDGYSKFELPYLSSLEQTRGDRQVNALPFFVAPLSYRAPKGFAKIPLPSPHVGSIVVNSPNSLDLRDYSDKTFIPDVKFQMPTTKQHSPPQQQFTSFTSTTPERPRTTAAPASRFRFGSEVVRPINQQQPNILDFGSSTTTGAPITFNEFKTSFKSQGETGHRKPVVSNDFAEPPFNYGIKQHYTTNNNFATVAPPKQTFFDTFETREPEIPAAKIQLSNTSPFNMSSFTPFKSEEIPNTFFTQSTPQTHFITPEPINPTTKLPDVTKYDVTVFDEPSRYTFTSPSPIGVSPSVASVLSSTQDDRYDTSRDSEINKMKSYYREQEAYKSRPPISISTAAPYLGSSSPTETYQTEKGFNEYSE